MLRTLRPARGAVSARGPRRVGVPHPRYHRGDASRRRPQSGSRLVVLKVGLTGGVASGKSAVADAFVELGAALVDTDAVAREVVAKGTPGLAAVVEAFGETVRDADGELDRRALRRIVFDDPQARQRLERILHPLIRERTLAAAEAARGPYVLIAVPLLVETGFGELVDRVLVVDCPPELQAERLIERDGVDAAAAESMIAAQAGRDTRLAAADDVIDNGGTLEQTHAQVRTLHERYIELAGDDDERA